MPSNRTSNEISIYKGTLTTPAVIESVAKIKKSFPTLPVGFYEVLSNRLKENGFNDARLKDAVNNVIDTCHYPTPTIADFISFDKKFKVLHYDELLKKVNELGPDVQHNYLPVQFPDREKLVWVHVDDIKKYKIEVFKPETK